VSRIILTGALIAAAGAAANVAMLALWAGAGIALLAIAFLGVMLAVRRGRASA